MATLWGMRAASPAIMPPVKPFLPLKTVASSSARCASSRRAATAASLWATGAIGVAVGLGNYDVAAVVCLFTIATLYVLSRVKPERP